MRRFARRAAAKSGVVVIVLVAVLTAGVWVWRSVPQTPPRPAAAELKFDEYAFHCYKCGHADVLSREQASGIELGPTGWAKCPKCSEMRGKLTGIDPDAGGAEGAVIP